MRCLHPVSDRVHVPRSCRYATLALAALAAVPFAACGGGGASADGGGPIPIDELLASIEISECLQAVACGVAPSVDLCRQSFFVGKDSITQDRVLMGAVAAVKRGTIRYDGQKARRCLDATFTGCVDMPALIPGCETLFEPTVADGSACQLSAECLGGRCTLACPEACCVGACAASPPRPAPVGASCVTGGCVAGAFCQDGICVAPLPSGSGCTFADRCQPPAACVDGAGGTLTCVVEPDEGMTCTPATTHASCLRSDDYCEPVTLVCVRKKPPGAACATSDECQSDAPCLAGACTPKPTLDQACDIPSGTFCLGHLDCLGGTCIPPLEAVPGCTP